MTCGSGMRRPTELDCITDAAANWIARCKTQRADALNILTRHPVACGRRPIMRGVAAGRSAERQRSSDWRRGAASSPDPKKQPHDRKKERSPDPKKLPHEN